MNHPETDDLDDLDDPLAAEDDTFEDATGTGSDADFEDFDEPPVLCGIFRGHVADAKRNSQKEQIIIEVVSEEAGSRGAKATMFLSPEQYPMLKKFATNLGVKIEKRAKGWRLWGGLDALKNKSGLFFCDTYERDDGTISSSLMKWIGAKGKSPSWDEYAATQNFSDKQLKALKASPGVINPKDRHLFE